MPSEASRINALETNVNGLTTNVALIKLEVTGITDDVKELTGAVETVKNTVESTGKDFASFKGTVLTRNTAYSLMAVAFTVLTFVYTQILPDKISNNPTIKELNDKSTQQQKSLDEINKKLGLVGSSSVNINDALVKPLKDPSWIVPTLTETFSDTKQSESELAAALPQATKLLAILREGDHKVPDKEYVRIATPLFMQYDRAKKQGSLPGLQSEIWKVALDLAFTKSRTDVITYPLPSEAELDRMSRIGKLLHGESFDLSSKGLWTDTIFRNCWIKLTQPTQDLTLRNVRFVNADFQLDENNATQSLVKAVVKNEKPTTSGPIISYWTTAEVTDMKPQHKNHH